MPICPTCNTSYEAGTYCTVDGERLIERKRRPDRTGQVLADRYRILRKIGQGGTGEVFEAEHVYIQKRVALKLLLPHMATSEEAVQRLHREAHATSAIGHPNIVHMEDFGRTEDGYVFLAMEWLDGETADAALERGPLALPMALEIAAQICDGLAAAHDGGLIHRDLKPANLFLLGTRPADDPPEDGDAGDARVQVKLLDFGLAKLTNSDASLTRAGSLLGTPHYMAPEQAESAALDHRCDLYALGVILYEMVTGSVPFPGGNALMVLRQHVEDPVQPPTDRAPERDIPPELEALILRCLGKRPDDRPSSARVLRGDIDQVRVRYSYIKPGDAIDRTTIPGYQPGNDKLARKGAGEHRSRAASSGASPGKAGARRGRTGDGREHEATGGGAGSPTTVIAGQRGVLARPAVMIALIAFVAAFAGVLTYLLASRSDGDGKDDAVAGLADPAPSPVADDAADAADADPREASGASAGDPEPPAKDAAHAHHPPSPDAAAATAPPPLQVSPRGKRARYQVGITPRSVTPGEPVRFAFTVSTDDRRLRTAMRAGKLRLELAFKYYLDHHTKVVTASALVDREGRSDITTALDIAGKYHTHITVSAGKRTDTATFDLCVGADPDGPRDTFEKVCPRMDRPGDGHSHDH